MNGPEFNKRMRELGQRIAENALVAQRSAAMAILQAVVVATPVDTGRARSNWQVGLGVGPQDQREPYDPGGQNITQTVRAGQAIVDGHLSGSIHIANNLPYINALNEGHSPQASAGFVERSVAAGMREVRRIRLLAKRGGR